MSGKSGLTFRIVAGGYVAYTGITLFINAFRDRPDNFILYLGIGVIFALFGGLVCGHSLKKLLKYDEKNYSEE